MNGHYLALAGRIWNEINEIAAVVGRAGDIWEEATGDVGDYHVDAVALNLHGFYAGIERLLEAIADTVELSHRFRRKDAKAQRAAKEQRYSLRFSAPLCLCVRCCSCGNG